MRSSRSTFACVALAGVTALVFSPALEYDFVRFDDPRMVTEHEYVSQGLTVEGLLWSTHGVTKSNWHPVTLVSHMIDVELYGLDAGGHHATSVLLHALNAALLFLLLHGLTGHFWRSALVAALFALHPLRVESVAWISQRKDVLSTSLGLLSLMAYARYVRGSAPSWLRASLAFFGAALLAKPMVVTLPFALLLLDYWPLERRLPGEPGATFLQRVVPLVREKAGFFLLAGTVAILTVMAQSLGGATRVSAILPLGQRLANAVVSYVSYLGQAVWPDALAVHYPHRYVAKAGGIPPEAWEVAGATALLLGISAGVYALRRNRYLVTGWLWYLGMLVPVIGLIQVGTQAQADRYTYLPLVGIFVAVVWGLGDCVEVAARRLPAARLVAAAVAVLVLAAYGSATSRLLPTWRDSLTLFEHAVRVSPSDTVAQLNLAHELVERGRLEDAIPHYMRALESAPRSREAHEGLRAVLERLEAERGAGT